MIFIANLLPILSLVSTSLAVPIDSGNGIHIPLVRRATRARTADEWQNTRDFVIQKYTNGSSKKHSKRGNSVNVPLTDLAGDTSYSAQVNIGTSGTSFNVILDTGSSDLWVAGPNCNECTASQTLDPSSSSTLSISQQQLTLQYGSGSVLGLLATDTVSIGGFSVNSQNFVLATQVSQGLLQGDLSGLLGLGFQSIAVTQATPLIEALAEGNQLTSQEMAFFLTRHLDDPSASSEAPGGTFTIGGTNSSLFQGDIDFVNIPSNAQPSFWLLPVTDVTVDGTILVVNSGTPSLAAIDTGTTLIGGPSEAVAEIYSKIPGSQALTGQMDGYYSFPCANPVSTSFTFSSNSWNIDPADFSAQQLGGGDCLGALFALDLGNPQGPDWVIGDTFLKNVYSVFRFNPPSVGFAELASNLLPSGGASTPAVTGTGTISGNSVPSNAPEGDNNNSLGGALSVKVSGPTIGLLSGLVAVFVSGAWIL